MAVPTVRCAASFRVHSSRRRRFMFGTKFRKWLSAPFKRSRRSGADRPRSRRLWLEALEDRSLPATSAFFSMPTSLLASQGGVVSVPVTIDHLSQGGQDLGLHSATLMLTYDTAAFTVTNSDVTQGALLSNPPPNGAWSFTINTATAGQIDVTAVGPADFSKDITVSTGGVFANINFHVKPAAPSGPSNIHIVLSPNGPSSAAMPSTGPHSLGGNGNGYNLHAADQVDGVVSISGPATHFIVSAPSTATAGSAFSFTVTAADASNVTASSYTGTVHFTSTDGQAVLPGDVTLTNGTGTFSATLEAAGNQTITAPATDPRPSRRSRATIPHTAA